MLMMMMMMMMMIIMLMMMMIMIIIIENDGHVVVVVVVVVVIVLVLVVMLEMFKVSILECNKCNRSCANVMTLMGPYPNKIFRSGSSTVLKQGEHFIILYVKVKKTVLI